MLPILFITKLDVGGMQRVCVTLCNEWTARGKAFLLYVSYAGGEMSGLLRASEQLYVADTPARFAFVHLIRLCQRHKESPLLIINAEIGILLLILRRVGLIRNKIVYRESTSIRAHCSFGWQVLFRLFISGADGFITQSPSIASELATVFPVNKPLRIIRNPCSLVETASPAMFERRNLPLLRFLMVGRLVPLKGHVRLLRVLKNMEAFDWRLAIVGDGESRAVIQEQVRQLGLTAAVEMSGSTLEVRRHYEAADIVVMASTYEGLPSTLIEALACGCRVLVVENRGGTVEFMRCIGLGEFVFSDSMFRDRFEACVQNVLSSDVQLWQKAYARMARMVHPAHVADQIWAFLEEIKRGEASERHVEVRFQAR